MNEQRKLFFRLAGELYGRLRDELGFGNLTMSGKHIGCLPSKPNASWFQWSFKAKEKFFQSEVVIDERELFDSSSNLQLLAQYYADRWKEEAREFLNFDIT